MPTDSSAMHAAVLAIVARPLEDSLTYAQRQHPLRTDINPLIETLKPHTHRQRREASFYSDLENWATTSGGGLLASLRNTIEPLIPWTSAYSTSTDVTPPAYTHRQLIETLKILGAKIVMQFFLDEITARFLTSGPSDLDVLLDIIVTMITAPQHPVPSSSGATSIGSSSSSNINSTQHMTPPRQLSLYDALHREYLAAFHISKKNLPRATIIVRLHRRVEAYLGRSRNEANGVHGAVVAAADVLLHDVVGTAENNLAPADLDEVLQKVEADTQMAQELLSVGGAAAAVGFLGVR